MNTAREARGLTGASDGVTGGERARRGTPAATPAQSSKLCCRHRCHRGHPGRLSRPRTHPELRAGFRACVSSRSKELAVRIRLSVSESSVQTQQRRENSQGLPRPSPRPRPAPRPAQALRDSARLRFSDRVCAFAPGSQGRQSTLDKARLQLGTFVWLGVSSLWLGGPGSIPACHLFLCGP